MPIKAVLFDMFDTLMMIEKEHAFYSPAVKSMHQYIVKNGVPVTFADFRDAYIKARDQLYEEADPNMDEPHFDLRVKIALQNLGFIREAQTTIVQGATNAFSQQFMNYVRIDDDAARVLNCLYGKYRLGLVSNFAIPECVQQLLEREQVNQLFEAIIISGAVNKRKPNPEIFNHTLQQMRINAAEAIFVGDTVDADVQGPQNVGMKTVYIDRRPQKELETIHPDYTIKSLNELPKILEKFK
jgi:putative hydrolase of the HAD superfamily